MSGVGDNHVAADQLRQYLERIERLAEERKGINDDIKDIFLEAKSQGYDTKTMRKVLALRKMDKDKRDAETALLDTYLSALGLL